MTLPNQNQVLSALRWLITSGAGFAIGKGWITADQVPLMLGAAAALVPLVWSMLTHTDSAVQSAAAATPGVERVVLKSSDEAAANPSPKVVGPEALK